MYHRYTPTTEQPGETERAMPLLAQMLADWDFESFQEEPDKGLLQTYISDDAWRESREIDSQLAADVGALTPYGIVWHYRHEPAPSSDWLAAWRSTTFELVSLRGRILVTTPKLAPTLPTYELQLLIEAYNSFGSGEHHATCMILEHLFDYDVTGIQVIDMGCETGILGIVALLSGADSLVAIDISPECVTNMLHDPQLNGFAPTERISVLHGDAMCLSVYPSKMDLLFANIYRNIIPQGLSSYVAAVRLGGEAWLSGFLLSDRTVICSELVSVGSEIIDEAISEEWLFARTRKVRPKQS